MADPPSREEGAVLNESPDDRMAAETLRLQSLPGDT